MQGDEKTHVAFYCTKNSEYVIFKMILCFFKVIQQTFAKQTQIINHFNLTLKTEKFTLLYFIRRHM